MQLYRFSNITEHSIQTRPTSIQQYMLDHVGPTCWLALKCMYSDTFGIHPVLRIEIPAYWDTSRELLKIQLLQLYTSQCTFACYQIWFCNSGYKCCEKINKKLIIFTDKNGVVSYVLISSFNTLPLFYKWSNKTQVLLFKFHFNPLQLISTNRDAGGRSNVKRLQNPESRNLALSLYASNIRLLTLLQTELIVT
jgi:hypothetical protein